jgi:pimeloyl-ACP methyl ester carboxylesterase
VRRGVDVLEETCSLVPAHVGYVGHSYGATFGGVVAGIEHRISAFVLMAGWYALSELARSKIPPGVFAIYMDAMAPLEARHYTGHTAPAHLFFQFAYDDPAVSIEDGERYFELASEPKQIAWYENCGHVWNAEARIERVTWLCAQFGLPEPSQEVLNLLEQVPSPVPIE